MKVTKYYAATFKDGEKKGEKAPFFGVVLGDPTKRNWRAEVFQERADGSFFSLWYAEFDSIFHAESGLRKFRSGLKWQKVK